MSQMDLFGGETPTGELEMPAIVRMLAAAERERDSELTADEAGALIHERRSKHGADTRCRYCAGDGAEALQRLRQRIPLDSGPLRREPPASRLADGGPESSGPGSRASEGSDANVGGDVGTSPPPLARSADSLPDPAAESYDPEPDL